MKRDKRGYGYRDDEELYVDDQSCNNCRNPRCPMKMPISEAEHYEIYGTVSDFDEEEFMKKTRRVQNLRKEDAIIRDGEPVWCAYWQGKGGRW